MNQYTWLACTAGFLCLIAPFLPKNEYGGIIVMLLFLLSLIVGLIVKIISTERKYKIVHKFVKTPDQVQEFLDMIKDEKDVEIECRDGRLTAFIPKVTK